MLGEPSFRLANLMKDKAKSMKIYEVADRAPELIENLVAVWEKSVRATHNFLSDSEIMQSVPWSTLCSRRTSARTYRLPRRGKRQV